MPNDHVVRVLFIGDIVGKAGRRAVRELLPTLKREWRLDFVVANGENAAGGIGITPEKAQELFLWGIDVITTGNHIWKRREIIPYLDKDHRILRPANYPPGTPGRGSGVFKIKEGISIGVLNLEGRIFMKPLESPFKTAKEHLSYLKEKTSLILVDFHAEATSEKMALGWFLDGEVSAVIGTHTHVQTADERILPKGTSYLTDAGMTGPVDSVIGMKKETAIATFITQLPNRFEVAGGKVELQGVYLELDAITGKALKINRLKEPLGGSHE